MMPSSVAPTRLSQPRASASRVVAGDKRKRSRPLNCAAANFSSSGRRSRSGRSISGLPPASASRSNAIISAGVSSASRLTRLAAGWMRCSSASNENALPSGTTISPSSTKRFARSAFAAATISGKYRVSGLPDFACSATLSPSRQIRQRKPSHFGSYCHCGPVGTSSTDKASMGGNGGCNASGIREGPDWCRRRDNGFASRRFAPGSARPPPWQNPKLQNKANWDNSNDSMALERILPAAFALRHAQEKLVEWEAPLDQSLFVRVADKRLQIMPVPLGEAVLPRVAAHQLLLLLPGLAVPGARHDARVLHPPHGDCLR